MLRLAFLRGLPGGFVAGASSFADRGGVTLVARSSSSSATLLLAISFEIAREDRFAPAMNHAAFPWPMESSRCSTEEASRSRFRTNARLDNTHYPDRLPDWLWQDERRTGILGSQARREFDAEIKSIEALRILKKGR